LLILGNENLVVVAAAVDNEMQILFEVFGRLMPAGGCGDCRLNAWSKHAQLRSD